MAEEPVQRPDAADEPEAHAPADEAEASQQDDMAEDASDDGASAVDAAEEALEDMGQAVSGVKQAAGVDDDGSPMDLPDLGGNVIGEGSPSSDLKLLNDVNLHVTVELGRTRMYIEDVLKLNENSVIELDKLAGDPVDIYVNDQHVARGEVLVLNDNFCVRVSEVIQSVGEVA